MSTLRFVSSDSTAGFLATGFESFGRPNLEILPRFGNLRGLAAVASGKEATAVKSARALLMVLVLLLTACGTAAVPKAGHAPLAIAAQVAVGPPISARFQAPLTATPIAVASVSAQVGYVLEQTGTEHTGGALLYTADGGTRWTTQLLPSGLQYAGLYANSAQDVVVWAETPACTGSGQTCVAEVLRSRDGGRTFAAVLKASNVTWQASAPYGAAGLWLTATSAGCYTGCRAVTALYASVTGGASWTLMASGKNIPNFAAIWTNGGSSAYGLASQSVYQSTNGGRGWTRLATLPTPANVGAFSALGGNIAVPAPGLIDISTCNSAAAGGAGCPLSVFQSTNGGQTFRDVLDWSGTQSGWLHMVGPKVGTDIMMGLTGGNPVPGHPHTNIAITTTDGFATTRVAPRLPLDVSAVSFRSAQDGWAVGTPTACFGGSGCQTVLATTRDGGLSWSLAGAGTHFIPSMTVGHPAAGRWWGLTAGSPETFLTSHNGVRWHVAGTLPHVPATGCGAVMVADPSARVAYLLDGPALFRSGDAGHRWTPVPPPAPSLTNIWFASPAQGVALAGPCNGRSGTLYTTADAGQHWRAAGHLPTATITEVFSSARTGFALQSLKSPTHPQPGMRLLETANAGQTWIPVRVSLPATSLGLFTVPGHALVVAALGSLVIIRGGHTATTVNLHLMGSSGYYRVDGWVPVGAASRLEVFIPGAGLYTGPWAAHTLLAPAEG